jgi:hypothetical protein
MRKPTPLCLLGSVLALVCACGGRSDKHEGAGGDGSGASSGSGATHPAAGSPGGGAAGANAGTGSGSGGTTSGSGGTTSGSGGTTSGSGGTTSGTGGATAGTGGSSTGESCDDIVEDYAEAYEEAKQCDPSAEVDECTQKLQGGLTCGCDDFVNPAQSEALMRVSEARSAYAEHKCRAGVMCGQCLAPIRGRCSDAGRCEGVPPGAGRSCKVDGKVYADGESNIPDPVSCNTCECEDGALACTEIGGCERPCPDGYAFGTDCAQCGSTDACEIPEYGCFRSCQDGCAEPGHVCVGGLCLAGLCG